MYTATWPCSWPPTTSTWTCRPSSGRFGTGGHRTPSGGTRGPGGGHRGRAADQAAGRGSGEARL